jgi:hypothetical protein
LIAVTAPALIFEGVTAFFLSCLGPTLFLGSVAAAHEMPPSAMNNASEAVTLP